MKFPALAFLFLGFLGLHAGAAVSPIRLTVEQHSSTKLPKAKPGHPPLSNIAQHRSLTIKLTNNSADAINGLVVKYFFIGHDLKDHNLKVLQHGERKSSVEPRATDTVDSEEAVNTYTDAHSELSKGKGKSKGRAKATKVQASGQKVVGYAVQVFSGTKLEVEEYSNPEYKKIVGASAPSLSEKSADPSKAAPKKTPKKK